ncbi:MerR family transcriptional regulator [Agromyces protaetiae]|uniref:MerR family transcriptional regulator n=1 Tax=Agromyces protaetiae TaxID=2509455 RepID=A0A4V0YH30_9MICO|nr:MerR family transcriptional regulator [Agromyces protaetiae]QAY73281.1 MerR family transcriptional regulator [Agromyces protaetiae]
MRALGTGEMSRASGLSQKALRLYAANGLLVPAEVDPATGYRRYSPAQIARGRAIGLLRRLDMPLATVAEVLDGPPETVRERLLAWWAGEHARFRAKTESVERVWAGLENGGSAVPDASSAPSATPPSAVAARVRIEHREAQTVATITRVVDQASLVPTFIADVLELRARIADSGAEPLPGHTVIYHGHVGRDLAGRIETCVAFTGPALPSGPMVLRVEPAAEFAVVDVTAREVVFPDLLDFFVAVERAAGSGPLASSREWYPGPWPDDPDAVAMLVATPFARPTPAGVDPAPGAGPRVSA